MNHPYYEHYLLYCVLIILHNDADHYIEFFVSFLYHTFNKNNNVINKTEVRCFIINVYARITNCSNVWDTMKCVELAVTVMAPLKL